MAELRRDKLLQGKGGTLSPEEHHEWAVRVWRRMDRDGSGSITREELDCEEFRTILRKVVTPYTGRNMGGPRYARAVMNMDQAVHYFLRKADCNADSSISFTEFKSFMYTLRQGHLDSADMIFALFDLDSDQTINQDEFREVYRFFAGYAPTEMEFQDEWGKLDATGKGQVSRFEYKAWLKATENPIFRGHIPAEASEQEMEAVMAIGGGSDGSQLRKDAEAWRPWHGYRHFAWNDPTGGKPGHTKMKFRDASRCKTSHTMEKASKSASTMDCRPPWNQKLVEASPNWLDQNGKPRRVVTQRQLFSRPKSLPELRRHLDAQPRMREHTEALFAQDLPRQRSVLSHERDGSESQVLSLMSRSKPSGSMRHPWTRERTKWNQHFLTPPQLADLYDPSPTTAIGTPPRHLYADLYDDEF